MASKKAILKKNIEHLAKEREALLQEAKIVLREIIRLEEELQCETRK